MKSWIPSAVLAVFLLAACATSDSKKSHGDVRFVNPNRIEFPNIPLGYPGTHRIQVRNLSEPLLPTLAFIPVPRGEFDYARQDQPWRPVVFEATFTDLAGKVLNRQVVEMDKDWGGFGERPVLGRNRVGVIIAPWDFFSEPGIPQVTDYDLTIRVLTPSRRSGDHLEISAANPIPN